MANRKTPFINGEYYHLYNRGVDKRDIFIDLYDVERFLQSIKIFNSTVPIGSIYERSFNRLGGRTAKSKELVEFVAYCLNPNHYHFILRQIYDGGISEFMKRLGGYSWYFNNRHKRTGSLFQGKFKSIYIDSNEYLLYLSSYVNLNNRVHQLGGRTAKLAKSSWEEYVGDNPGMSGMFCKKGIVLEQFKGSNDYRKFAEEALHVILENKERAAEEGISGLLLE